MSQTRYVGTRASGIEWLGDVPTHWMVKRLKFSVRDARNGVWGDDPTGEGDIRCVRVADFDRPHLQVGSDKATYRSVSLADRAIRGLSKGDLLLEKSGGGEKSPVGFVVRFNLDEPAVCSNFVARVRLAPGMDSRFWTYVHHSNYQKQLTQRSIKQTSGIQNLDQQSYLDELAAFPDASEQLAIADFLDRETAKIDELIGKQNALIELLGERRGATIDRSLIEIGVDELTPLRYVADLVTVGIVVTPSKWYAGDGVIALRGTNVKPDAINLDDVVRLSEEGHHLHSKSILRTGDVVIVRTGQAGAAAVIPAELNGINAIDLLIVHPGRCLLGEFLVMYMNSPACQEQTTVDQVGSIQGHFNVGSLKAMRIPLLPIERQKEMVNQWKTASSEIDLLTCKAQDCSGSDRRSDTLLGF